jgi:hypothetical protein
LAIEALAVSSFFSRSSSMHMQLNTLVQGSGQF